MVLYSVVIDVRVRKKDLPPIPTKDRKRIVQRITQLADNPYPPDSIQLTGDTKRRIRQSNYRIIYAVDKQIVTVRVVKVGHRSQVYK